MLRLATLVATAFAFVVVLTMPREAHTFSSGAPAAHTGAPGEQLCTDCHGSFDANSGSGGVTIDAPDTYAPGGALTLTVAVDNTTDPAPQRKSGFQVTVQDDAGNDVGSFQLVDPALTRFATGSTAHVTHTSTGSSTATSWAVQWTAPDPAPTSVTVYAAGNAANGDGTNGGDFIYTASKVLTLSSVAAEDDGSEALALEAVWPNPTRGRAALAFALAAPAEVTVALVDGRGRRVRTAHRGALGAGPHTVALDAAGLAAGLYFAEVATPAGRRVLPLAVVH